MNNYITLIKNRFFSDKNYTNISNFDNITRDIDNTLTTMIEDLMDGEVHIFTDTLDSIFSFCEAKKRRGSDAEAMFASYLQIALIDAIVPSLDLIDGLDDYFESLPFDEMPLGLLFLWSESSGCLYALDKFTETQLENMMFRACQHIKTVRYTLDVDVILNACLSLLSEPKYTWSTSITHEVGSLLYDVCVRRPELTYLLDTMVDHDHVVMTVYPWSLLLDNVVFDISDSLVAHMLITPEIKQSFMAKNYKPFFQHLQDMKSIPYSHDEMSLF